jgi:hypothetical protein
VHGGLRYCSLMPFEAAMEEFIHRGNIALFKRRLAETRDEAERAVIVKLLADEEAKDAAVPPNTNGPNY